MQLASKGGTLPRRCNANQPKCDIACSRLFRHTKFAGTSNIQTGQVKTFFTLMSDAEGAEEAQRSVRHLRWGHIAAGPLHWVLFCHVAHCQLVGRLRCVLQAVMMTN